MSGLGNMLPKKVIIWWSWNSLFRLTPWNTKLPLTHIQFWHCLECVLFINFLIINILMLTIKNTAAGTRELISVISHVTICRDYVQNTWNTELPIFYLSRTCGFKHNVIQSLSIDISSRKSNSFPIFFLYSDNKNMPEYLFKSYSYCSQLS